MRRSATGVIRAKLGATGAALAVAMTVAPAQAAGVGAGGFVSGVLHPMLGFDHFLAMLAVGLLSVQLGGMAIWTVPAAFVAFLGAGGALGFAGVPLPAVEGAIAFSVLALGVAIAARAAMPVAIAMLFVGFFAVFHGHAHGAELPELASPFAFAAGFMLASAALHLLGVGLGLLSRRSELRAQLGAGVAGIGLHMLLLSYSLV